MFDLFKGVSDADRAAVVICNTEHIIVYMNKAAILRYDKELTGSCLLQCHNAQAGEMILKTVARFRASPGNNMIYT